MREVPTIKVREILRKSCGERRVGHAARSSMRRKSLPLNILFSLGNELQNRGIMSRREFLRACRS